MTRPSRPKLAPSLSNDLSRPIAELSPQTALLLGGIDGVADECSVSGSICSPPQQTCCTTTTAVRCFSAEILAGERQAALDRCRRCWDANRQIAWGERRCLNSLE